MTYKQIHTSSDLDQPPMMQEVELYLKPHILFDYERVKSSADAAAIFKAHFKSSEICLREEFKALYLNRANYVIGICTHSVGSLTGTVVDIKQVMATAIKTMSSGIILCHNHPSGSLIPSQADIQLTEKFEKAAELFDVQVLDHIIISHNGYHSMADSMEL